VVVGKYNKYSTTVFGHSPSCVVVCTVLTDTQGGARGRILWVATVSAAKGGISSGIQGGGETELPKNCSLSVH